MRRPGTGWQRVQVPPTGRGTGTPPIGEGQPPGAAGGPTTSTKGAALAVKPSTTTGGAAAGAPEVDVGKVKPPSVSGGKTGLTPEIEVEGAARVGRISTAITTFHVLLMLGRMIPNPLEEQAIQTGLTNELNGAKWQARLSELQATIAQASGSMYYNIRFRILYTARQSPKPSAFANSYAFKGIEVLAIDATPNSIEVSGDLDQPDKPESAHPVMGGGYYWDAHRICTTSSRVKSGGEVRKEQELRERSALIERLRKLNEKAQQSVKTTAEAAPATPPAVPSFFPAPAPTPTPAVPQLLPGATGENAVARAARAVGSAEAEAKRVLELGSALRRRIGTQKTPAPAERTAFFTDEERWRVAIELMKNYFKGESRFEAVSRLDELVDMYGPKLHQIRLELGGD